MKAPLIPTAIAITAAALLSFGAAHAARDSSPSEMRGYQACLKANKDAFRGIAVSRDYLLAESDSARTYYINATAWHQGERVPVAFSCTTTRSGRLLENAGATFTQYVPAKEQPVRVAGN